MRGAGGEAGTYHFPSHFLNPLGPEGFAVLEAVGEVTVWWLEHSLYVSFSPFAKLKK